MNKKLKRKQALIMAEPYRTPFNSKVAKVSGDVIEDSVGGIKYATSFDGATKIEDANNNNIEKYSVNAEHFLYFCIEEPYVLNYFEYIKYKIQKM